jgi:uncharacterized damage-inducible protein DinB
MIAAKELVHMYVVYHSWANTRIVEFLKLQSPQFYTTQVPSSFSSIHATIAHMAFAENVWLMRMSGGVRVNARSWNDLEMHELFAALHDLNREYIDLVAGLDDNGLAKNIDYKNSAGESFSEPLFEIVLHVFNHGTYHRGQIVNMCRQLNASNLPRTDLIDFMRRKA